MINHVYIEYLLLKIQQDGDNESLSTLLSIIQPQLFNFTKSIIGDNSIAQDALQESMMAIVKNLHKLKDHRKFHAWIYRLTRNKCYDLIRKSHKYKSNDQQYDIEQIHSEDQSLDNNIDILNLINKLPRQQQVVVQLFYYNGFTIPEIANILNKPAGTIKSLLFEARQTIKHNIGEK